MTEFSEINSFPGVINYYHAKDRDHNGQLDGQEAPEIAQYLENDPDGLLAPYELMTAVNSARGASVFSTEDISYVSGANDPQNGAAPRTFPDWWVDAGDPPIQGIAFPPGTHLTFHPDGELASADLTADTIVTIQGQEFTFKKGTTLHFERSGGISGTLAKNVSYQGNEYKAGTLFALNAHEQVTHGTLAKPGQFGGYAFAAGTEVHSTDDGVLSSAILSRDTEINGMKFKAQTQVLFNLHVPGQVSSGVLASDWTPEGMNVTFKAGTAVEFADDGSITSAAPPQNLTLTVAGQEQPITFLAECPIGFNHGKIVSGTLAADATIDGVTFSAETVVFFDKDGKISFARLSQDTMIDGILFPAGTEVRFSKEGRVARALLSSDTIIQGYKFAGNTEVLFAPSGKVFAGVIAEDTPVSCAVAGVVIKAGTEVLIRDNGKVMGGTLARELDLTTNIPAGSTIGIDEDGHVYEDPTPPQRLTLSGGQIADYYAMHFRRVDNNGGLQFPREDYGGYSEANPSAQPITLPITSDIELINYYDNDTDNDGLEAAEVGMNATDFGQVDRNRDAKLSPWEVMEAVNRYHPTFSHSTITYIAQTNLEGNAFPAYTVDPGSPPVQGIPFPVGAVVHFDANGHVASADLPQNAGLTIDGVPFKPGTEVKFTAAGMSGTLARDTELQVGSRRIKFRGDTAIAISGGKAFFGTIDESYSGLPEGSLTTFDLNGNITQAIPPVETIIDGIKYPAGLPIAFINGRPASMGTLTADKTFPNGLTLGPGSQVVIGADGNPTWAKLAAPTRIGNRLFPANTILKFEEGHLKQAILPADTDFRIGNTVYRFKGGPESPMDFNSDGSLWRATLANDTEVNVIVDNEGTTYKAKAKGGTDITFHNNGQAHQIILAENFNAGLFIFKAESDLTINTEGGLDRGVLASGVSYEGPGGRRITMEAGEIANFDDNCLPSPTGMSGLIVDGAPI